MVSVISDERADLIKSPTREPHSVIPHFTQNSWKQTYKQENRQFGSRRHSYITCSCAHIVVARKTVV